MFISDILKNLDSIAGNGIIGQFGSERWSLEKNGIL